MICIFLGVILFLTGCVKNTSYEIDSINSDKQSYRSARLRFSESNYKEMEFEVLFLSKNLKCFLNFYHSSLKDDADKLIEVLIDDKTFNENCFCLRGNQRLMISEKISKIIIDSLNAGKKISIIHNKSTISIDGQEFAQAYERATRDKSLISSFLKNFNQ